MKLWKGDRTAHVVVLFTGKQKELTLWLEFELLYVEIPAGEKGDMTAFDLESSFTKHEITVRGKPYTVERYLDEVGFDYSYTLED